MGHAVRTPRRWGAALMVAAALLTTVSCGSDAPAPAAAPSTSSTPAPPPPPPPPPPPAPVLWPLTGVESGAVPPRPALAVKIENSVDSRPQTGLNSADVVWEEVVEGGITRFVAVFHSTVPAEIGPIRSVRPMDPPIAAPLRGLFAFSGGQGQYVDAIAAAGLQVVSFDAGDPGFYRSRDRFAPHNVYADPQQFLAQADAGHQAPPAPQFDVPPPGRRPTAVLAGTPTTTLQLRLSRFADPRWTWSEPDARWVRSEGDTPATEADGTPLRAVNVVVMRVDVVNTTAVDPAGNPVPDTVLVGSGEALVATGGRTVAATWTKTGIAERVTLTGADGLPLTLAPGNTWVELVPNGTGDVAVS